MASSFTTRYNVDKLVFFEETSDVQAAIAREKQIKAGSREKKIALVNAMNPDWRDLFDDLAGYARATTGTHFHGDCFVATLLAMTVGPFHAHRPSFLALSPLRAGHR